MDSAIEGWIGVRLDEDGEHLAESSFVGGGIPPAAIEAVTSACPSVAWVPVRIEPARRDELVQVLTIAAKRKAGAWESEQADADAPPTTSTTDEVLAVEVRMSRGCCPLRARRMLGAAARRLTRRGELTDERAALIKAEAEAIEARMSAGRN